MLVQETKLGTLTELEKYIFLLFDDMKIKEGLVNIIRFVDLGDINNIPAKLTCQCNYFKA